MSSWSLEALNVALQTNFGQRSNTHSSRHLLILMTCKRYPVAKIMDNKKWKTLTSLHSRKEKENPEVPLKMPKFS